MENINKQFIDGLIESEKHWGSADHIIYVTMPFVKDSRLLIKALEGIHKSLVILISTILKFEYFYKRVNLSKDVNANLNSFFAKCSGRYGLGKEDSENIKKIFYLGKKHKESGLEFSKSGKIFIMNEELGVDELNTEKMKNYIKTVKKLLLNANRQFRSIL